MAQAKPTQAKIHLLVRNPQGALELSTGNYSVLCSPEQDTLPKHATDQVRAATCRECLALVPEQETVNEDEQVVEEQAEQTAGVPQILNLPEPSEVPEPSEERPASA